MASAFLYTDSFQEPDLHNLHDLPAVSRSLGRRALTEPAFVTLPALGRLDWYGHDVKGESDATDEEPFTKPMTDAHADKVLLGQCPTCMENLYSDDTANMSCGHMFHVVCANAWKPRTCPLCRARYTQVKSDHVFELKRGQDHQEEKKSPDTELWSLIQRLEQVEQDQQTRQFIDLTEGTEHIHHVPSPLYALMRYY